MENTEITTAEFTDFDNGLVRASSGQRIANYLIDIVIFYILFIIVVFLAGIVLAIVSPSTIENLEFNDSGFHLGARLLIILFYALYMGIMEGAFKGYSIGKLITGTRAVNLDGSAISVSTAFVRGFSRAVPFCVLSAFGTPCNPWQDRWTDTLVIDKKSSGR